MIAPQAASPLGAPDVSCHGRAAWRTLRHLHERRYPVGEEPRCRLPRRDPISRQRPSRCVLRHGADVRSTDHVAGSGTNSRRSDIVRPKICRPSSARPAATSLRPITIFRTSNCPIQRQPRFFRIWSEFRHSGNSMPDTARNLSDAPTGTSATSRLFLNAVSMTDRMAAKSSAPRPIWKPTENFVRRIHHPKISLRWSVRDRMEKSCRKRRTGMSRSALKFPGKGNPG